MNDEDTQKLLSRIEATVQELAGDCTSPAELLAAKEMVCIQILDSEHMNYPEGELEAALMYHLDRVRPKK